jgi:hypothetical protein
MSLSICNKPSCHPRSVPELQSEYAEALRRERNERFSTLYTCTFVRAPMASEAASAAGQWGSEDCLLAASSTGHVR